MKNNKLVYISLLNWSNYEDCISCVKSLEGLAYSNFKIIIRDNNSPNNSFEILKKQFPQYLVVQSKENNGYAAGHFENWQIAKKNNPDYFWVLNVDLTLDKNALRELIIASENNEENIYGSISLQPNKPDLIDFAGGNSPQKLNDSFSYNIYKDKQYSAYLLDFPTHREVQSVEGSSMFLSKTLIEKYGFMKLDFFMYGEETDYAFRLRKKGVLSILVSKSIVYHQNQGSFKNNNKLTIIPAYYRRRNMIRFLKEHYFWSNLQLLNYNDSIFSKLKFLIKCFVNNNFKSANIIDYYLTIGLIHGVFGLKGKTIDPKNLK